MPIYRAVPGHTRKPVAAQWYRAALPVPTPGAVLGLGEHFPCDYRVRGHLEIEHPDADEVRAVAEGVIRNPARVR